jgi:cysteine desulfurase/selenocysteine lyase
MISNVEYHQSRWNEIPHKFEAGTPNMAGAVGLHTAMDYLDKLGRDWIDEADRELADYAVNRLKELPELEILGPPTGRAGIVSFLMKNVHAHDIVTLTDRCGIALRGGHHCNQPLMRKLGVESTARASFSFYNTTQEIDRLVEALKEIQKFFNQ